MISLRYWFLDIILILLHISFIDLSATVLKIIFLLHLNNNVGSYARLRQCLCYYLYPYPCNLSTYPLLYNLKSKDHFFKLNMWLTFWYLFLIIKILNIIFLSIHRNINAGNVISRHICGPGSAADDTMSVSEEHISKLLCEREAINFGISARSRRMDAHLTDSIEVSLEFTSHYDI